MNSIGQLEKITQERVVELFQNKLEYRYLAKISFYKLMIEFDNNL